MEKIIKYNNKLLTYEGVYVRPDVKFYPSGPPQDYVAAYFFSENDASTDETGNYNLNTISGTYDHDTGIIGWGWKFDGGTYTQASTPLSGDHDFSISFWIKTTTQGEQSIIAFGGTSMFITNGGSGSDKVYGYIGGNFCSVGTSVDITDGSWHHCVWTYDNSDQRIFINTIERGTLNGTQSYSPSYLRFGSYQNPAPYYTGILDQAYVYDRLLSTAEISALYNGGIGV
jgi:hypothetical protein